MIRQIGRILGRDDQVPTAEKIFAAMPPFERMEDDVHPLDPDERPADSKSGQGKGPGQWRQRRPLGPQSSAADREEDGGETLAFYSSKTTMDASSGFTVSALPGFTTANAHQTALRAAAQDLASSLAEGKPQPLTKHAAPSRRGGTTKRPADQPSVAGFFAKKQKSDPDALTSQTCPPIAAPTVGGAVNRQTAAAGLNRAMSSGAVGVAKPSAAQGSGVPSDLSLHKLGSSRLAAPVKAVSKTVDAPRKHYPQFSSSPPRPASPENAKGEEDEEVPQGPPDRPASCFHVTTTTMPSGYAGFTRPAAVKKEGGIAPIDRLRKPFKPLTINRGGRRP